MSNSTLPLAWLQEVSRKLRDVENSLADMNYGNAKRSLSAATEIVRMQLEMHPALPQNKGAGR